MPGAGRGGVEHRRRRGRPPGDQRRPDHPPRHRGCSCRTGWQRGAGGGAGW